MKIMEIILHPRDGVLGCKVEVYDRDDKVKVRLISQSTGELLDQDEITINELGAWCHERVDW